MTPDGRLTARLQGRARCHRIASLVIAGALLTSPPARSDAPPQADTHLFPHALHAAAGTCFPRYHLELWDSSVARTMAERTPTRMPAGVPECKAGDVDWAALRRYFQTEHGTGRDALGNWQRPRLAVDPTPPWRCRVASRGQPWTARSPRCRCASGFSRSRSQEGESV